VRLVGVDEDVHAIDRVFIHRVHGVVRSRGSNNSSRRGQKRGHQRPEILIVSLHVWRIIISCNACDLHALDERRYAVVLTLSATSLAKLGVRPRAREQEVQGAHLNPLGVFLEHSPPCSLPFESFIRWLKKLCTPGRANFLAAGLRIGCGHSARPGGALLSNISQPKKTWL
jgi:hypothetical protein